MGLDMYLNHKIHVSDYSHDSAGQATAKAIRAVLGIADSEIRESGTLTISQRIGYWRKANAIHAWFVENVQDGNDQCQESDVSEERLEELCELCKLVLLVPGRAAELLPAQEGFFFGDTSYGQGYLDDLKDTVEIIDYALAFTAKHEGDFTYQASW